MDGATLFKGACCQGYCPQSAPNPNPPPQPVTEVPRQPKVSANRKKAGPKKPEPKPTAAAQPTTGKSKKKLAASVKTGATKPTNPGLVLPTVPLKEISDLLDCLPLQACEELTNRLLTSISSPDKDSLPAGSLKDRHSLRGRI